MNWKFFLLVFLLLLPAVHPRGGRGGARGRGRSGARHSSSLARGRNYRARSRSHFSGGRVASRSTSIRNFNSNPTFTSGTSTGSRHNAQRFTSSLADSSSIRYYDGVPTVRHSSATFVHGSTTYLYASASSVHRQHGAATAHSNVNSRKPPEEEFCRMPLATLINAHEPDHAAADRAEGTRDLEEHEHNEEGAQDSRKKRNDSPTTAEIIEENQWLAQLQFANGTLVDAVIWKCGESEVCCGTECCSLRTSISESPWILIAVVGLLFTVGCYTYAHLEGYCRDSRYTPPAQYREAKRTKGKNALIAFSVVLVLSGVLLVLNFLVFHL
ncbi:hypothetical protein M3Y99_01056000 [Aphelenchoides fujianensis]|nr:hypothetical protein M3Y99_01056000 [Aphelenchoides fujianensis]